MARSVDDGSEGPAAISEPQPATGDRATEEDAVDFETAAAEGNRPQESEAGFGDDAVGEPMTTQGGQQTAATAEQQMHVEAGGDTSATVVELIEQTQDATNALTTVIGTREQDPELAVLVPGTYTVNLPPDVAESGTVRSNIDVVNEAATVAAAESGGSGPVYGGGGPGSDDNTPDQQAPDLAELDVQGGQPFDALESALTPPVAPIAYSIQLASAIDQTLDAGLIQGCAVEPLGADPTAEIAEQAAEAFAAEEADEAGGAPPEPSEVV